MNLFSFQMLKYFRKFDFSNIQHYNSANFPSVMFDKIYHDNTENTTKQS